MTIPAILLPPRAATRRHPAAPSRRPQRGAATLAFTLLLLAALALAVGYAGRHVLVEQQAATNQQRSAQALAAAEAGIDWAIALLAAPRSVGDDCLPSAAGQAFRDRALQLDATAGRIEARTWTRPDGTAATLRMACVAGDDGGWNCRCPAADGSGAALALPAIEARPAFSVAFASLPRAGTVQLAAVGCARATAACLDGSDATGGAGGGAIATVQVTLGLLPTLATPPVAALTARGSVATGGPLVLRNTDPSASGLAVQAGGTVAATGALLDSAPGRATATAVVEREAALADLDADRMFVGLFGLDRGRWRQLPGVLSVACPAGACDEALAAALRGVPAGTPIRIGSDLRLDGPIVVGAADRPVALVVEGRLQLGAGAVVHGLVHVAQPSWNTAGSRGGMVHGALTAEGSVGGDGAFEVVYDAPLLARLHGAAGTFAPVPGSWRDF